MRLPMTEAVVEWSSDHIKSISPWLTARRSHIFIDETDLRQLPSVRRRVGYHGNSNTSCRNPASLPWNFSGAGADSPVDISEELLITITMLTQVSITSSAHAHISTAA